MKHIFIYIHIVVNDLSSLSRQLSMNALCLDVTSRFAFVVQALKASIMKNIPDLASQGSDCWVLITLTLEGYLI